MNVKLRSVPAPCYNANAPCILGIRVSLSLSLCCLNFSASTWSSPRVRACDSTRDNERERVLSVAGTRDAWTEHGDYFRIRFYEGGGRALTTRTARYRFPNCTDSCSSSSLTTRRAPAVENIPTRATEPPSGLDSGFFSFFPRTFNRFLDNFARVVIGFDDRVSSWRIINLQFANL